MAGQLHLVLGAGRLGTGQRVAGAAVLGLVIPVVLAWIWRRADAPTGQQGFGGLGKALAGCAAGAVVVAGVTLAGFAWLQVRPLPWTVLTAAVVTVRMLWALVAAIPVACARHWRASMGAAPVPALVALAAAPGWPRVAGLLSLATLLAASLVLPAPVHRALQRKLR